MKYVNLATNAFRIQNVWTLYARVRSTYDGILIIAVKKT